MGVGFAFFFFLFSGVLVDHMVFILFAVTVYNNTENSWE